MTDSKSRSPLHVMNPPISEAEEIPFDPAKKGPGLMRLVIDFDREEIDRLRARHPRGPLIRFIKQAALDAADRSAQANSPDTHAAD